MCFLYLIQGLNETVMTKIITSGHTLMAVLGDSPSTEQSTVFHAAYCCLWMWFFLFFSFSNSYRNFLTSSPDTRIFFFQQAYCMQTRTELSSVANLAIFFLGGGVKRLATNLANLSAAVGDFWRLRYETMYCFSYPLSKALPMCACTNGK